jgi:hypothetical protein
MLQQFKESWPDSGPNKVRLPGGKYVKPGFAAWCQLHDAQGGLIAEDGQSAARVLLIYQTPADLVPASPCVDPVGPASELTALLGCLAHPTGLVAAGAAKHSNKPRPCDTPTEYTGELAVLPGVQGNELNDVLRNTPFPYPLPKVDAQWEARYGQVETTTLWFAILEDYAAAWFNEHHLLEEIRPLEYNHMALSPNGDERTASTSYRATSQGERYTDHSLHGRRPDGTRDSGDALEFASKVWAMSKAEILRETTREITSWARAALESAANAGKPLPLWLEEPVCIITPAGRQHFARLLAARDIAIATSVPPTSEPMCNPGKRSLKEVQVKPAPLSTLDSRASVGPYPPPARPFYCCHSTAWRWNDTEGRYGCGACQGKTQ